MVSYVGSWIGKGGGGETIVMVRFGYWLFAIGFCIWDRFIWGQSHRGCGGSIKRSIKSRKKFVFLFLLRAEMFGFYIFWQRTQQKTKVKNLSSFPPPHLNTPP